MLRCAAQRRRASARGLGVWFSVEPARQPGAAREVTRAGTSAHLTTGGWNRGGVGPGSGGEHGFAGRAQCLPAGNEHEAGIRRLRWGATPNQEGVEHWCGERGSRLRHDTGAMSVIGRSSVGPNDTRARVPRVETGPQRRPAEPALPRMEPSPVIQKDRARDLVVKLRGCRRDRDEHPGGLEPRSSEAVEGWSPGRRPCSEGKSEADASEVRIAAAPTADIDPAGLEPVDLAVAGEGGFGVARTKAPARRSSDAPRSKRMLLSFVRSCFVAECLLPET